MGYSVLFGFQFICSAVIEEILSLWNLGEIYMPKEETVERRSGRGDDCSHQRRKLAQIMKQMDRKAHFDCTQSVEDRRLLRKYDRDVNIHTYIHTSENEGLFISSILGFFENIQMAKKTLFGSTQIGSMVYLVMWSVSIVKVTFSVCGLMWTSLDCIG